jgi:hypothetical protein
LEEDVAVAEGDVGGAAEGDVAQSPASPITANINASATIHRLFLFDSDRRTLGRRACSAMVIEAELRPGFVSDRVSSVATASRQRPPKRPVASV